MGALKDLYHFVEKTFFNSLTKKMAGNILFLVFIQVVTVAIFYIQHRSQYEVLRGLKISESELQRVVTIAQNSQYLSVALCIFSLIASVFSILFLRYMLVRPLKEISATFAQKDLSVDAPLVTYDEIRDLSKKPRRCFEWVMVTAVGYAQGARRARQNGAHGEANRPV